MARDGEQRAAELRIAAQTFGAVDEPQVQLILGGADVGNEFGMKSVGIVHQVAGMDFEESCEQHARGVSEMRPRPAFDLREIGLADGLAEFLADGPDDFLLGQFAIGAAESAFDFAEVAEFFAESHIAICNYTIAICNFCQWDKLASY